MILGFPAGRFGLRDLAGERQHQGDGVLGGRDRIAERRVHHDDALGRGGGDLDIVDADAGAADHLEVGRLVEDFRGRLGRGADRKAVIVADDLGELVLVLAEIGLKVDLDAAVFEDLNGCRRERIGNENFGFGHWSDPLRKSLSSRPKRHLARRAGTHTPSWRL